LEVILDTNALSAAADREPAALQLIARAELVGIPVIVLGEYRIGIIESRRRVEYEMWLRQMIGAATIFNIDEETAGHFADISVELRKIGRPIPTNDIWIAAICRQYGLPVISRDRHFDYVRRLRRIAW
jgi:predicted nucleic acid-binding protein